MATKKTSKATDEKVAANPAEMLDIFDHQRGIFIEMNQLQFDLVKEEKQPILMGKQIYRYTEGKAKVEVPEVVSTRTR